MAVMETVLVKLVCTWFAVSNGSDGDCAGKVSMYLV